MVPGVAYSDNISVLISRKKFFTFCNNATIKKKKLRKSKYYSRLVEDATLRCTCNNFLIFATNLPHSATIIYLSMFFDISGVPKREKKREIYSRCVYFFFFFFFFTTLEFNNIVAHCCNFSEFVAKIVSLLQKLFSHSALYLSGLFRVFLTSLLHCCTTGKFS